MKSMKFVLFLFCISSIFLTSCLSDDCIEQRSYTRFDPIYMTASEFRLDIQTESLRSLENPGRMYFYENYLFINEKGLGIHIYDNSDRNNPSFVTFYKIPGNFDISIKDGYLVADNVIDLITIDIQDVNNPVIIDRIEDFKGRYTGWEDHPERVYWAYSVASPIKEVINCSDANFGFNNFWRGEVFFTANVDFGSVINAETSGGGSTGSVGIGGSTSRFTIVGNYLYIVDNYNLLTFEFQSGFAPILRATNNLGWGIETIYPFQDKLFIGSTSGMHIYSISNPESPSRISTFQHARACDPVVVRDDKAYVTLRDGRLCDGFLNQLDVIDISDITDPTLIKSYSMKNPNGMTFKDNILFLSESSFGLKALDITDSQNIKELVWNKEISSTDLIYLGDNTLMSIGATGFYQYDVSDIEDMKEISYIPVQ